MPDANEVKPKKGWSNPALRMMGIPRISLPSRNWMIFWTVVTTIGGGIAYDKYEQKQMRKKWMDAVKQFGEVSYGANEIPRKLTIFIAPPPNDFLDESLKLFRKFIKPVLNAGVVDFEIFSESRQGDIRASVAEKIRELRRKQLVEETPKKNESNGNQDNDEEELKSRSDLYKAKDVLGLYKVFPADINVKSEDAIDDSSAGGIICVGRGAYKEYLSGVHEGLLGPLEKPQSVIDEETKLAEEKKKEKEENPDKDDDNDEEQSNLKPVPLRYIQPEDYANAQLAPELDLSTVVKDDKGVPVFFEQPVYTFPLPNLVGFTNIPRKIYRYFTKRFLVDDFGERTATIVNNKSRPFVYKDVLMAKEEEMDWPKKWVEKGKERNSEWVQELEHDERVTSRMKVFE
ncbi:mitochondrial import inner membrane translocase subunit TIM54 [Candida albicans SC5314]|nr:mitochondrial import inner membrane translocase subunit TIM54 [Candida albicans 19F]KHC47487.1 mitochondrial import inner membrane translocase subunit TIM54 [Candida albicans P37039]KHC71983.1 mitochondrial import inner membrane translocase subunit TIM54 [Candida albicans SC5314]